MPASLQNGSHHNHILLFQAELNLKLRFLSKFTASGWKYYQRISSTFLLWKHGLKATLAFHNMMCFGICLRGEVTQQVILPCDKEKLGENKADGGSNSVWGHWTGLFAFRWRKQSSEFMKDFCFVWLHSIHFQAFLISDASGFVYFEVTRLRTETTVGKGAHAFRSAYTLTLAPSCVVQYKWTAVKVQGCT